MVQLWKYQQKLYTELKVILKPKGSVGCLAATTGAGKTEIAMQLMLDNPRKRFLILTHGQKELRTNFSERIENHPVLSKVSYEVSGLLSQVKVLQAVNKAKIVIALPHSIHNHLDNLDDFDYILVDEAHQFFEAKSEIPVMYPKIKEWHKGRTLLLTASHYGLKTVTKDQKSFFAREDGLKAGKVENVPINRAVVTNNSVQITDYTISGDLRDDVQSIDTYSAVHKYLKSEHYPMLIAVRTQNEAREIGEGIAAKRGLKNKVTISVSEDDRNSEELKAFKAGEFDICVVVNRGQLGFDYPGLRTFIDGTYSKNVQRIEQMLGRVTRKKRGVNGKQFVKLCLSNMMAEFNLILTAVLALGERSLYESWDGQYKTLKISVPKDRDSWSGDGTGGVGAVKQNRNKLTGLAETFGQYIGMMGSSSNEMVSLAEGIAYVNNERINDPVNHKHSIKIFYELNNRIPRVKSKDQNEQQLGQYLCNYCSKIGRLRDSEFYQWVVSVGYGLTRSEKSKAEIKNFFDKQGRLPIRSVKDQNEFKMADRLSKYCSNTASNSLYDYDFHQWASSVGYRNDSVQAAKTAIKIYYGKHNKWPHRKGNVNERKLYGKLCSYTSQGPMFDPEFNKWARENGYGKR